MLVWSRRNILTTTILALAFTTLPSQGRSQALLWDLPWLQLLNGLANALSIIQISGEIPTPPAVFAIDLRYRRKTLMCSTSGAAH